MISCGVLDLPKRERGRERKMQRWGQKRDDFCIFAVYWYANAPYLAGSKDTAKKVGGWRPLGCHLRVGRDRKPLRSGSGDVNGTKNKSGEHLTRHGNLAKKSRSKKVFTLKGKKNSFKAKQPNFKKRRLQTLWLYLIAAFDQSTLCRNLNLSCEAEVEMQCGGKIVNPGMTLHDLADCFLDKGPKSRVRSSVGSPATGFVATLFYGRPELPPPPPESCHG